MKFVKNCKTFALAGALALLLTGCGPTTDEALADVDKAMTANIAKDFAKLKFEERRYQSGLHPTMVFEGKNSRILAVTKPTKWAYFLAADEVKMSGVALTKNGRYFLFTYMSPVLAPSLPFWAEPCIEDGCRHFDYAEPVSRSRAMEWLFNSDVFTPERFKELFDEEAPPKHVEA